MRPGDKIPCPRGHHLHSGAQRVRDGAVQCLSHLPDGHHSRAHSTKTCGAWVYVAVVPGLGTFVLAVDLPDLDALDHCRTPDEVFTLLDIWPD